MLAVTGQVRADLRSKPAVVEKILQIKGHRYVPAPPCPCAHAHCAFVIGRHTSIDCERSTIDEECLEARRSFLPKPHTVEYMIFGKFKMQAGGSSFKDTYFFTLRELKEGGFTKPQIKLALEEYVLLLAAVEDEELGDISSEDEAAEEEEEGEEGEDGEEGEGVGGAQAAAVVGNGVEDGVEDDDDDDSDDGGRTAAGGYGLVPCDRCLRTQICCTMHWTAKTCCADVVMFKQMHIHCLSMDIHELKIRGYPWITMDIPILNEWISIH